MYLTQSGMQKNPAKHETKHLSMKIFYSTYCYKLFLRTTAEQVKTRVLNLSRDRRARIREKETMQREKIYRRGRHFHKSINAPQIDHQGTRGEGGEDGEGPKGDRI